MKKGLLVISLVALFVVGAATAYGYGPGYGPRAQDPCAECWGPGRGLNLTPDQKAKLQDLRQKFISETANLRGELLAKRMELQALWANPKADPKAIVERERELRELQNQMREKGLQHRLEIRQILTPEQLAGFGPGRGWGFGKGPKQDCGFGWGKGPGRGPCF